MKRKKFIFEICVFLLIGLLTGCGESGSGDAEDAPITSKWKLVEFLVNGETMIIAMSDPATKLLDT